MPIDFTDPTTPIVKDPDAVLDYSLNLTSWLVGETITAITIVKAAGVTVDSSSIVSGNRIVLWVSGGYANSPDSVTVRFTTSAGRTDDRTMFFTIKHR